MKKATSIPFFSLLLKTAVFLFSIGVIVFLLLDKLIWLEFLKDAYFNKKGVRILLLMLVAMFLNISVEAFKWKFLIRTKTTISFNRAVIAVFSGVTAGLITPHGIGDYVGRILFLYPDNRLENIGSVLFSRVAQLCITCITGVVATVYFCFMIQMDQRVLVSAAIAVATLLVIFLLWKFRAFVLDKMQHIPLLKNIEKWFEQLRGYSNRVFLITLGLSALRYGIFLTQFVILLVFFEVHLSIEILIIGAVFTFFVKSIVPTFFDLGVREMAAVFFFSTYGVEYGNVLAASISLWFINLLVPSIIGLFCMFHIDYTKK